MLERNRSGLLAFALLWAGCGGGQNQSGGGEEAPTQAESTPESASEKSASEQTKTEISGSYSSEGDMPRAGAEKKDEKLLPGCSSSRINLNTAISVRYCDIQKSDVKEEFDLDVTLQPNSVTVRSGQKGQVLMEFWNRGTETQRADLELGCGGLEPQIRDRRDRRVDKKGESLARMCYPRWIRIEVPPSGRATYTVPFSTVVGAKKTKLKRGSYELKVQVPGIVVKGGRLVRGKTKAVQLRVN